MHMKTRPTIVHKHCTKVAHNVDDKEDDSLSGSHGKIGALGVTLDRMRSSRLDQPVIDFRWGAKLSASGVRSQCEYKDNDKNNDGVDLRLLVNTVTRRIYIALT
jgi:hypothetical protein